MEKLESFLPGETGGAQGEVFTGEAVPSSTEPQNDQNSSNVVDSATLWQGGLSSHTCIFADISPDETFRL